MSKLSIIIPCYNSEQYLPKLLNSILEQTHQNLEIIVVNDGSTDNSQEVLEYFKNLFTKNGIPFLILVQENKGQAAAVNLALKKVSGQYLTWIDTDDWLEPTACEDKIHFLETHPEFGFVRTDVMMHHENSHSTYRLSERLDFSNVDLFQDLILIKNVYFAPGGYLVKMEALKSVLPHLEINEARAGQNWQLLLPLALKFKCGYIDKPLFNILVRKESHSNSVTGLEAELYRADEHRLLVLNILSTLDIDQSYWFYVTNQYYDRKKIDLCYKYKSASRLLALYSSIPHFKSWIKLLLLLIFYRK